MDRNNYDLLTTREAETVRALIAGYTDGEIAKILGIHPGTVRSHLSNAYEKLGVRNRTELLVRRLKERKHET